MSLSTSTKTCQYFPLVYLHVYSLKTIECNFWSVGSAVRLLIFWCWLHHLRALRALISYWVLLSLCFPICQLRIIIFSISKVGWKGKQNNIAKIFTPRKVPKLWKVWVLVSSLTCTRNDSAFYTNKEPWSCLKSKPSALGSNMWKHILEHDRPRWFPPAFRPSRGGGPPRQGQSTQGPGRGNPWLDGASSLVQSSKCKTISLWGLGMLFPEYSLYFTPPTNPCHHQEPSVLKREPVSSWGAHLGTTGWMCCNCFFTSSSQSLPD